MSSVTVASSLSCDGSGRISAIRDVRHKHGDRAHRRPVSMKLDRTAKCRNMLEFPLFAKIANEFGIRICPILESAVKLKKETIVVANGWVCLPRSNQPGRPSPGRLRENSIQRTSRNPHQLAPGASDSLSSDDKIEQVSSELFIIQRIVKDRFTV